MTTTSSPKLVTPGDRESAQAISKSMADQAKRGDADATKIKISGRPAAGADTTLANLVDATTALRKAIRDREANPAVVVGAYDAFILQIQAADKDLSMVIENAKKDLAIANQSQELAKLRAELAEAKAKAKA